jgi:hypothetical protein
MTAAGLMLRRILAITMASASASVAIAEAYTPAWEAQQWVVAIGGAIVSIGTTWRAFEDQSVSDHKKAQEEANA